MLVPPEKVPETPPKASRVEPPKADPVAEEAPPPAEPRKASKKPAAEAETIVPPAPEKPKAPAKKAEVAAKKEKPAPQPVAPPAPEPVAEEADQPAPPKKAAKPAKKPAKAKQKPAPAPVAEPEPAPAPTRKRDASRLKAEEERAAAEKAKAKAAPTKDVEPVETKKSEPKKRKRAKPAEDPAERFRRLIRETGPISLAQYMGESNALYYSSRDPFGEEGDFITAPEISQMFGELIGLWLADLWVRAGSPKKVHYVELGPGRGTLAMDALRTAKRYGLEPKIHFVEGSEELREIQAENVRGVVHHHDLSTIPADAPILVVANEFFDALPIHQLLRAAQGWTERMVGLDGERLVFVAGDKPMDSIVPSTWRSAPQGTLIETSPAAAAVMNEISERLIKQGGAALIIDYGGLEHRSGSTLQALRQHKKVDPLAMPGEADITAHVDFEMLRHIAQKKGAAVMGTVMQGEWLTALGIETRTEALQRKQPAQANVIKRQRDRLVAEDQMGLLFKVLGVHSPNWPNGVGF